MRISNFASVLGGANTLVADQLVNGAARTIPVRIGSEDNPVDITGYTLEFDTQQASATSLTPARGNAFTVGDLVIEPGSTPVSRDALASIADAPNGLIHVYIPVDYYSGTVGFDSNTDVPCVIGNLRYSNGATTNPEIGVVRVLHFIRYGVIAP